jgi:hypothetical protein
MVITAFAILLALLLAGGLARASLHFVGARQAAIICDRHTGRVRRLIAQAGPTLLVPWLDRMLPFDLTLRTMRIDTSSAATCDGFTVLACADIFFSLDAALLRAADLNQVLPFLDRPEASVRPWAEHTLRALAGEQVERSLLRRRTQAEMGRRLQDELQPVVAPLGVRIHRVRLSCQRDPRLVEAQLAAQARGMQWAKLAEVLGRGLDPARLLSFETLARLDGNDARILAAFAVPAEAGLAGSQESLPLQWVVDTG